MNTRMDRKKLNIGTYILQPYARTEKHIRELAECGIDFVVCMDFDPEALGLFEKYGVGAVVTKVLPAWWGGDGENAGQMETRNGLAGYEAAARQFRDCKAVWGIDCGDEPSMLDFRYCGKIIRFVENAFPNQFPYLNLYPNYASVAKNSAAQTNCQLGTASYQEYIDSYVENVPTDYICYDHYMYSTKSAPRAYENLRVVAEACRRSGRSLWIVLQVNSSDESVWISENQLRQQAYTALAFGSETIIWACWTAGWWGNQVLDSAGEKTEQYGKLKAVNAELRALGGEFMKYRGESTYFLGFRDDAEFAAQVREKPVDSFSAGPFRSVRAESGNAVVGFMKGRSGGSALVVADAADPFDRGGSAAVVRFECSGVPKAFADGKPAELRQENGVWLVPLSHCGGTLVTV